MNTEIVFLVEEAPEGGYTARALSQAIFTEGDTPEQVEANARDAVKCHFEDDDLPKVIRLHYVRDNIGAHRCQEKLSKLCLRCRLPHSTFKLQITTKFRKFLLAPIVDQIIDEYPGVSSGDIAGCLAYASAVIKEEKVYPARAV